jgi:hypothetical protein
MGGVVEGEAAEHKGSRAEAPEMAVTAEELDACPAAGAPHVTVLRAAPPEVISVPPVPSAAGEDGVGRPGERRRHGIAVPRKARLRSAVRMDVMSGKGASGVLGCGQREEYGGGQ